VHYWWLVKADITRPEIYALIVAVLLGFRLYWSRVRVAAKPARAAAARESL
jgi:sulfoxide reductase heme-binding subunit YedZ